MPSGMDGCAAQAAFAERLPFETGKIIVSSDLTFIVETNACRWLLGSLSPAADLRRALS